MSVLIVFDRQPYDGTDVTWNGLRLCGALKDTGEKVHVFLMNDAVDLARDACTPPEGYDQDLSQMLRELIADGVLVKVCGRISGDAGGTWRTRAPSHVGRSGIGRATVRLSVARVQYEAGRMGPRCLAPAFARGKESTTKGGGGVDECRLIHVRHGDSHVGAHPQRIPAPEIRANEVSVATAIAT
jgi:uncharacterized protein involved in oxidation of intracellular sulfur